MSMAMEAIVFRLEEVTESRMSTLAFRYGGKPKPIFGPTPKLLGEPAMEKRCAAVS
jgi:hypothetical protein